jgi:predicted DNA-binding ribbon-helix-helix protein
MKLLQARVPVETWKRLTAIASKRDLSLAQLIRRILWDWLERNADHEGR